MADRTQTDPVRMEKIVSLCKRRGFIFQAAEIYGGLNGCWDYGPLGVELKRNLKDYWWRVYVQERPDVLGMDGSILTHNSVLVASGHVGGFSDPLCDCLLSKERLRADQIPAQSGVAYWWKGAAAKDGSWSTSKEFSMLTTEGSEKEAKDEIVVPGKEDSGDTSVYDVTGSLCENNDKFAIQRVLPVLERGDLVVICDAGAHGHAMGFQYNGKLRSAELLLEEDGSVTEIRRIVFRNDPGDGKYPTEIVGKRNFDSRVSADCLAWLRRDLELVKDKSTPIMVCMHHGAIRKSNKGSIIKSFTKPEYVDSLIAAFKDFSTVRFITAHAHRRRVSDPKELKNITEHTITPLGGNGWESSYNGFDHMCSDGATAGFEIFDYDGRDVKWSYRSVHDEKRTFRAYDMNSVMEYYRQNEDVKAMVQAYPNKRVNYGIANFANYVYINYWADEPKAKLEVWEGDKKLKPRRVYQDDPLFTIASVVVRHKNSRGRKLNFGRNSSQHLFRVKTDTATTVVKIRATDPFGRTFIDSLVRPTPFPPKAHKL